MSCVAAPGPSHDNLSAARFGVGNQPFHCSNTALVCERSHLCRAVYTVADPHCANDVRKTPEEPIVSPALDEEAGGRDAYLTSVSQLVVCKHLGGGMDIRIVEDDCRGVTTKLHSDSLHMGSC
ncbi:hypothetical protein D3C81_1601700 [compost metagenome]